MRKRSGFAIVIVVLISAVALLAFLFSSVTLTLASRSSAAQERASSQALLAADSGLKTLRARAAAEPYVVATHGTLTEWLNVEFGTLDLGNGVTAELEVLGTAAPPNVTIQSTGIVGTSRRVLVQAFEIVEGPPVPASVAVPGALTSVGNINNSSNAMRILGRANTVAAWSYANVAACTAMQGEYIVVGGTAYEVTNEPSCSSGSVEVRGGGPFTNGQLVNHRPIAIKEPLVVTGTNTLVSTVEVTDGARVLFGVGTPITIGNGTGGVPSQGVVTAVADNELSITWTVPPIGSPAEGEVVRRAVTSGTTAGDCNVRAASFPNGCVDDQNLDDLFFKTFGVANPQLLKDSLAGSQVITGSQLGDGRVLSDITWLSNPQNNVRDQTGTGILIIENNPGQSITLNVSNNFTGLIYVIGDANIQGNATMVGAIVVDGIATVPTNVQGTGEKVAYDPLELTRALAGITFPNPEAGGLGASVDGTWRVR